MKAKLLYEQIAKELKNKILSGEYLKDQKLPTENELAQEYNVSRITSKRALEELKKEGLIYRVRGSGSFVNEINEERMQAITTPAINTARAIAIIMPKHVTESSFAQSINGAVKVFEKAGYYSIIHSGVKNSEDEKKIIKKMYEDGIGGIIYYPVSDRENYSLMHHLYLENYPIVTIDKYFESLPISNVIADNYNGERMATEYLIKLGHEKIAFVSDLSIESTTSIRNRYFGYAKALKSQGKYEKEDIVKSGFTDEYHRKHQEKHYATIISELREKEVTGIIAVNDLVATYLMRTAIKMGVLVPEELSIIGFDDLEMSKHLQVPLTTIRQNFDKIGESAAELIIKMIESQDYEYQQIKLPVTVIERKSCSKRRLVN